MAWCEADTVYQVADCLVQAGYRVEGSRLATVCRGAAAAAAPARAHVAWLRRELMALPWPPTAEPLPPAPPLPLTMREAAARAGDLEFARFCMESFPFRCSRRDFAHPAFMAVCGHKRMGLRFDAAEFLATGPTCEQLYLYGHLVMGLRFGKAEFLATRPSASQMVEHGHERMGLRFDKAEFLATLPSAAEMAVHGHARMGLRFDKAEFLATRPSAAEMAEHGRMQMGLCFTCDEFLSVHPTPAEVAHHGRWVLGDPLGTV